MLRRIAVCVSACMLSLVVVHSAAAADIVLRASDFSNLRGNWSIGSDASAAGGRYVGSVDYGWATTSVPLAQPNDSFEATFSAPAGTPYHVWLRLRGTANSKYNESVWVQYSDTVTAGGQAVYRLGTTSGLLVNLERCSGCGISGWGWQDGAYWLSQSTTVQFATTGTHTLRVQIREDGVQIDQIVLSPATYLFASPGSPTNDTVIVPTTGGTTTTAAGPYLGSPVSLPGRVEAENFDAGPDGVSYHDATAGNTGGAYRDTNADIQGCAESGYNLGWIDAGEWANYTVTVQSAGSYTVSLRVASPGGGALHLGFNGPSNVWKSVSIPATGGWQNWTTVNVPVTLGAGQQQITILYDTNGLNFNYLDVAPSVAASTSSSTVTVVTWNVQVSDWSSAHAQTAIDYIMAMTPRPQVVVLQEAHTALYNTYISQLQLRSGLTWRGVFRTHCPPGAWNGSSCSGTEDEGVAVFTSLPVIDAGTTFLPYADQWHSARGVARLAVNVNGVVLQVFSVHMPISVSARAGSMAYLKSYASGYSAPQILGGDFNGGMNEIDPAMSPNFIDTWTQVGAGNGFTAFSPSPSVKIDYWLADAGGRARPEWSVVVTTAGTFSDHYALINSFVVR